jgi:hypothetical protein
MISSERAWFTVVRTHEASFVAKSSIITLA